MKILSTASLPLEGVKVVRYARFTDARGYFTEPYRRSDIAGLVGADIVQQNESFSRAGTLRGLHFQWNPYMGKLVRTLSGRMVDIVADIRIGSPTFGKAALYDMPAARDREWGEWIWVPPGFAHGNLFIEDTTIEYLCTGEYSQGNEAGISPLSPDIDFSLADAALKSLFDASAASPGLIMSDKDKAGQALAAWQADERSRNFIYGTI